MSDIKPKILIVDDDDTVRGMYAEVFRNEGFEVEEAADGLDGLDRATKSIPDVIFSGIIMPRLDGFGLKDALSKNVSTANTPFVMSSHMGRKEDEQKAREMGVRDFIVLNMVTPREAAKRIKALVSSMEYKLKLDLSVSDSLRLIKDLNIGNDFSCKSCGQEMVFSIKIIDASKNEFSGKIYCPNCNR